MSEMIKSWLRDHMELEGYSQRELALELGIDHSTLSRWFSSNRALDGGSLSKIMSFLGVSFYHVSTKTIYSPNGVPISRVLAVGPVGIAGRS